jgi:hypothetical protein
MGIEAKFNKWLVGAVMGKKYVWEHKHLWKESHQEEQKPVVSKKKDITSLKGFLQWGVEELKHNVRNVTFKKPPQQHPETTEE